MKRIFAALIAMLLLAGMIPAAMAEGPGWYVVDSVSPYGYAYLYSAASDRDEISQNLGKYINGRVVYVLSYYGGQEGKYNYCYVHTQDGQRGYMHDSALKRTDTCNWAETSEGWYRVASTSPQGYTYLYSAASDRTGKSRNLGRHENGELVYVTDYYGGQDGKYNYCYVRTEGGETGYMHDYALQRAYSTDEAQSRSGWYIVASGMGYAYLYSGPSDRDELSYNKGRHENGEMVYVVDYNGGQDGPFHYCLVRTAEGETGYMHESALVLLYPDAEETY